MITYDCTNDVNEHRARVAFWIQWMIEVMEWRAAHHDESKLQPPEKSIFDEYTPKLKELEFGSDEYKKALEGMGEGLDHHYKVNPHHPEHYKDGINGMTLWDLFEMVADWMAAASNKDQHIDLEYLKNRFDICPQLVDIIYNTLWSADMDDINCRIPIKFQARTNFADPRYGSALRRALEVAAG